ncbi:type IV toxin-antitoxin system AbiEi family antitoxin [Elusimicrobiota bacterium]
MGLLEKRLPPGWKVVSKGTEIKAGPGPRVDLLLELRGPEGKKTKMLVDFKNRLEPKLVRQLKDQLQIYIQALGREAIPLVVSPFISVNARQSLKEAGISYADTTGNMWLVSSRPGLYIETQGAQSNPSREDRPARSLKGAKAARVVRALCDFFPPFGVIKLAKKAGVDPGYTSRVLTLIESEDLIQREPRGPITDVRWRKLIDRWTQDYSFSGSNRVIACLEPRDIADLPQKLAKAANKLAVTGSAAAAIIAPVAPTRMIAAYVESPEDIVERLGLKTVESGANVLLAQPYDPVVFERVQKRGAVPYASPSQTVADLLTGPGRNPSEAQSLLEWMKTHESKWRS